MIREVLKTGVMSVAKTLEKPAESTFLTIKVTLTNPTDFDQAPV